MELSFLQKGNKLVSPVLTQVFTALRKYRYCHSQTSEEAWAHN